MTLTDFGSVGAWTSTGSPGPNTILGQAGRPITLTSRSLPRPRRMRLVGPAEPWMTIAVDRLNDLLGLPAGWDSYGADPLDFDNALAALAMLTRLPHDPLPAMCASPDGEVEMEWSRDDLLLVLVVSGTFAQPVARALFDSGSGCEEWSTTADDDDRLVGALRIMTEAN